jgi:ADP-ribosylglycohydrolase
MGNGAAMRVAPVGAWFADDLDALIAAAAASAAPTHAHDEGVAGAIAVALATAFAWRSADGAASARLDGASSLLEFAHARTPSGETRRGLATAFDLGRDASVALAASVLGTGARLTSPDTVPFSLWCADRHLASFDDALWTTVAGLGDRDTTCAIAGGIVAMSAGGAPEAWVAAREPLPW